jgi:PAS domain S-box-containing protein/putative nucleotidyltransferase with HDIG domain
LKTKNRKEEFFQLTLDSLTSHVAILDATGTIISVNQAWRDFSFENGIDPLRVSEGVNYLEICDGAVGNDAEEAPIVAKAIRKIIAGLEETFSIEYPCHSPEKQRWFIARITRFHVNQSVFVVIHHENITARKALDETLSESENKFRSIFEESAVAKSLTKLSGEMEINQAFADLLGYSQVELRQKKWTEITHPDDIEISQQAISDLLNNEKKSSRFNKRYLHKNGSIVWTDVNTNSRRDSSGNLLYFMTSIIDISASKRMEEEQNNSKRFLENLLRTTPSAIFTVDTNQIITSWNPTAERITGYRAEEVIGQKCSIISSPNCKDGCRLFDDQYTKPGEFRECELITKNGRKIYTLKNYDLLHNSSGQIIGGIESFIDITQRRETEQLLRLQGAALEAAANGIIITDQEGTIKWMNKAWCDMTGYSIEEALGQNPRFLKSGLQASEFYKNLWDTILSGNVWCGELINKRKDGSLYIEEETITPFKAVNGDITHFIAIKQDITERKTAEERIQRQLSRLAALREIDQSINSTGSLDKSLDLILTLAIDRLNIDAATILLMDSQQVTLRYAAGKGFITNAIETANVKPQESFLALSGNDKIVELPDESLDYANFFLDDYLKAEGFVHYYGAPLTVKGELIGLMELFHRSELDRDEEWTNFYSTLAGQAAIAIDNTQMFEKLAKTNAELIEAYDATIEGWSFALDLRDNETEGHSKRVTQMVIKLANQLGLNNDRLEQIRRGAILHDIGKMGVPDTILLKPGKLTEEEFEIIKKHPVFSYEMLSKIPFLRPAVDIPYCHHENWDGSGYPRGLKSEEIPYSARMFAMIDVYDALTSDRPYRKAWTHSDAINYIKEQAGIKFDPNLIPHFLEMISNER